MEKLKKLGETLLQYRYAALVLLVGIGLMLIPTGEKKEAAPTIPVTEERQTLTVQLEEILTSIKGVGRVEVLLTLESGPQTVYRVDEDGTVIITGGDRIQDGLVEKELSETYRGAVVVCQGADSPAVQLAVIQAVANVTGLGTDRIVVLKMK